MRNNTLSAFWKISLLMLMLALSFTGYAQDGSKQVDLKNFDHRLLNKLMMQKLNKFKDSLKLPVMKEDEKLKKAADLQAKYILKEQKLTHDQDKEKYKNVTSRVAAMDGDFGSVAENIAFTLVNKPTIYKGKNITIRTYDELANQLLRQWINSAGHLENLKTPFASTGFAFSVDPSANRVYAVNVFGTEAFNLGSAYKVPKDNYGVREPGNKTMERCKPCYDVMQSMPGDVKFGLQKEGKNIFFLMNDTRWFNQLFQGNDDGIAVDVIFRRQFPCDGQNRFVNSTIYKGVMLKPIYKQDLLKHNGSQRPLEMDVLVGEMPPGTEDEDVEFNLIIIRNKYSCYYNYFFDIPGHRWDLLNMGLYMDTLTADEALITSYTSKGLKFTIPFEKDKYEYSQADIKPLYDSLKLNKFNIKSVNIKAFASVEGSTERNLFLQQKRAESIVKALQGFQIDSIRKEIYTSENWVEFMEDVDNTPYSYLKDLSKAEIKKKLEEDAINTALEPILKKHRKAIIQLELEVKTQVAASNPDKLKQLFNTAIEKKDLEEAKQIQRALFSSIRKNHLPDKFIDSLEVPEKSQFSMLLNNRVAFDYYQNPDNYAEALKQFNKLLTIMPGNGKIRYNICVLQLRAWAKGDNSIDAGKLQTDILNLERYNIDRRIIKRLLINYSIIASEFLARAKKYSDKDKMVNYIYDNYKMLNMSEDDILNLAQYFTAYSKYQWATEILTPYTKKVDVKEDLLFFYLNLTIPDEAYTSKPYYKTILLNAINVNRDRFCKLFLNNMKGGITFQLLDDKNLKKIYCESCSGQTKE